MDIITADTIQQYNQFFGVKTKHPQVGIIHFNRSENQPTHKMTFGFYALYLVKTVGITMDYGKTSYDFDESRIECNLRDRGFIYHHSEKTNSFGGDIQSTTVADGATFYLGDAAGGMFVDIAYTGESGGSATEEHSSFESGGQVMAAEFIAVAGC